MPTALALCRPPSSLCKVTMIRGPSRISPEDPRLKELVDEIVQLSTQFGILTMIAILAIGLKTVVAVVGEEADQRVAGVVAGFDGGEPQGLARALARSVLISADMAHAVHPNYSDKHDGNHGPKLNAGPVIKVNSNQRYATSSETAGFFRHLCLENEVSVQSFVTRSDMGCGSTIGPITASQLGVRTVDIGLPTFGMHSIRELAGSQDLAHLVKVLSAFYSSAELP